MYADLCVLGSVCVYVSGCMKMLFICASQCVCVCVCVYEDALYMC